MGANKNKNNNTNKLQSTQLSTTFRSRKMDSNIPYCELTCDQDEESNKPATRSNTKCTVLSEEYNNVSDPTYDGNIIVNVRELQKSVNKNTVCKACLEQTFEKNDWSA